MFLTDLELAELTGLKRPSAQLNWLRVHGWPVESDARGRPKLLRAVVEARMGAAVQSSSGKPNWDALHGSTKASA